MADKEKKKKKCGGEGEGNDYNFLFCALNIVDIVLSCLTSLERTFLIPLRILVPAFSWFVLFSIPN